MARRDGRGPLGQGPLSGSGLGVCNGGNHIPRCGAGFSGGRGRGLQNRMGMGNRMNNGMGNRMGNDMGWNDNYNQTDPRTRKELLTEQKEALQDTLNIISEELESL